MVRMSSRAINGAFPVCNAKVDNETVNDNEVAHISCLISKKHSIDGLAA